MADDSGDKKTLLKTLLNWGGAHQQEQTFLRMLPSRFLFLRSTAFAKAMQYAIAQEVARSVVAQQVASNPKQFSKATSNPNKVELTAEYKSSVIAQIDRTTERQRKRFYRHLEINPVYLDSVFGHNNQSHFPSTFVSGDKGHKLVLNNIWGLLQDQDTFKEFLKACPKTIARFSVTDWREIAKVHTVDFLKTVYEDKKAWAVFEKHAYTVYINEIDKEGKSLATYIHEHYYLKTSPKDPMMEHLLDQIPVWKLKEMATDIQKYDPAVSRGVACALFNDRFSLLEPHTDGAAVLTAEQKKQKKDAALVHIFNQSVENYKIGEQSVSDIELTLLMQDRFSTHPLFGKPSLSEHRLAEVSTQARTVLNNLSSSQLSCFLPTSDQAFVNPSNEAEKHKAQAALALMKHNADKIYAANLSKRIADSQIETLILHSREPTLIIDRLSVMLKKNKAAEDIRTALAALSQEAGKIHAAQTASNDSGTDMRSRASAVWAQVLYPETSRSKAEQEAFEKFILANPSVAKATHGEHDQYPRNSVDLVKGSKKPALFAAKLMNTSGVTSYGALALARSIKASFFAKFNDLWKKLTKKTKVGVSETVKTTMANLPTAVDLVKEDTLALVADKESFGKIYGADVRVYKKTKQVPSSLIDVCIAVKDNHFSFGQLTSMASNRVLYTALKDSPLIHPYFAARKSNPKAKTEKAQREVILQLLTHPDPKLTKRDQTSYSKMTEFEKVHVSQLPTLFEYDKNLLPEAVAYLLKQRGRFKKENVGGVEFFGRLALSSSLTQDGQKSLASLIADSQVACDAVIAGLRAFKGKTFNKKLTIFLEGLQNHKNSVEHIVSPMARILSTGFSESEWLAVFSDENLLKILTQEFPLILQALTTRLLAHKDAGTILAAFQAQKFSNSASMGFFAAVKKDPVILLEFDSLFIAENKFMDFISDKAKDCRLHVALINSPRFSAVLLRSNNRFGMFTSLFNNPSVLSGLTQGGFEVLLTQLSSDLNSSLPNHSDYAKYSSYLSSLMSHVNPEISKEFAQKSWDELTLSVTTGSVTDAGKLQRFANLCEAHFKNVFSLNQFVTENFEKLNLKNLRTVMGDRFMTVLFTAIADEALVVKRLAQEFGQDVAVIKSLLSSHKDCLLRLIIGVDYKDPVPQALFAKENAKKLTGEDFELFFDGVIVKEKFSDHYEAPVMNRLDVQAAPLSKLVLGPLTALIHNPSVFKSFLGENFGFDSRAQKFMWAPRNWQFLSSAITASALLLNEEIQEGLLGSMIPSESAWLMLQGMQHPNHDDQLVRRPIIWGYLVRLLAPEQVKSFLDSDLPLVPVDQLAIAVSHMLQDKSVAELLSAKAAMKILELNVQMDAQLRLEFVRCVAAQEKGAVEDVKKLAQNDALMEAIFECLMRYQCDELLLDQNLMKSLKDWVSSKYAHVLPKIGAENFISGTPEDRCTLDFLVRVYYDKNLQETMVPVFSVGTGCHKFFTYAGFKAGELGSPKPKQLLKRFVNKAVTRSNLFESSGAGPGSFKDLARELSAVTPVTRKTATSSPETVPSPKE